MTDANKDLHRLTPRRASVCATCWHPAIVHAIDGEERRECAPSCGCQQYEDAEKVLADARDAYDEKDAELASYEAACGSLWNFITAVAIRERGLLKRWGVLQRVFDGLPLRDNCPWEKLDHGHKRCSQ